MWIIQEITRLGDEYKALKTILLEDRRTEAEWAHERDRRARQIGDILRSELAPSPVHPMFDQIPEFGTFSGFEDDLPIRDPPALTKAEVPPPPPPTALSSPLLLPAGSLVDN